MRECVAFVQCADACAAQGCLACKVVGCGSAVEEATSGGVGGVWDLSESVLRTCLSLWTSLCADKSQTPPKPEAAQRKLHHRMWTVEGKAQDVDCSCCMVDTRTSLRCADTERLRDRPVSKTSRKCMGWLPVPASLPCTGK